MNMASQRMQISYQFKPECQEQKQNNTLTEDAVSDLANLSLIKLSPPKSDLGSSQGYMFKTKMNNRMLS